jgi:sulfoxide reductase heme-binding subunit YedZ
MSSPAIRPAVYAVGAGLLAWVYAQPPPQLGSPLERTLWLGLFATVFLYLALLQGPLFAALPLLPGRAALTHARRALGINAAAFAGAHGYHGFFGWVGGFEGMQWWSWDYNLSLALGAVAWLVLLALAATSFDAVVEWLGAKWKRLHRLVYFAGALVVVHAVTVTIHVVNLFPLLVAWFAALTLLLGLELVRFRRIATPRQRALAIPLFLVAVGALYGSTFLISHHRH